MKIHTYTYIVISKITLPVPRPLNPWSKAIAIVTINSPAVLNGVCTL